MHVHVGLCVCIFYMYVLVYMSVNARICVSMWEVEIIPLFFHHIFEVLSLFLSLSQGMLCLHVCLCTMCLPGAQGGGGGFSSLELEFQVAVSHSVGAGN